MFPSAFMLDLYELFYVHLCINNPRSIVRGTLCQSYPIRLHCPVLYQVDVNCKREECRNNRSRNSNSIHFFFTYLLCAPEKNLSSSCKINREGAFFFKKWIIDTAAQVDYEKNHTERSKTVPDFEKARICRTKKSSKKESKCLPKPTPPSASGTTWCCRRCWRCQPPSGSTTGASYKSWNGPCSCSML